jgi:hypothetical protein
VPSGKSVWAVDLPSPVPPLQEPPPEVLKPLPKLHGIFFFNFYLQEPPPEVLKTLPKLQGILHFVNFYLFIFNSFS